MPAPRPPYFRGGCYHFYNRGAHRLSIFREEANYLFVIQKLEYYTAKLNLKMLAYCLMPNHYHFLVRQDGKDPAGLLPQRVFNSYSKAYNKRYDHRGTLFEGSYKVKQIVDDQHLLHLCRYIHGNPVKDGFVSAPENWPYSNYQEWMGMRDGPLFDPGFYGDCFTSQEEYQIFVQDYIDMEED